MLQVLEGVEASLHARRRAPFDFAQDKQAPALHAPRLAASESFNDLLRQDTQELLAGGLWRLLCFFLEEFLFDVRSELFQDRKIRNIDG